MNRIAASVTNTTERTQRLTRSLERVNERSAAVAMNFVKISATAAGIGLVANQTFAWQNQLQDQQRITQQLFDTYNGGTKEGAALTQQLTSNAMALSKVFGEDYRLVQESVNALTKQFGVDTAEAYKLVEQGFLSGANAGGDFLQQLREYPALMKETGINASQMIGIMTTQVKEGVYSDKGIDAIKEAMMSIREMTPATATAIDGLGISSANMAAQIENGAISAFDAIQQISVAFAAANPRAKGAALADIFRGPGEDAGEKFIASLGTMNTSLDKMVDTGNPLISQLSTRLQLEQQIATTQQQISDTITPVSMAIHKRFLEAKLAAFELAEKVFQVVTRFTDANPVLSEFIGYLIGLPLVLGAVFTGLTWVWLRLKAFTIEAWLAVAGQNGFVASLKSGVRWLGFQAKALWLTAKRFLLNIYRTMALAGALAWYELTAGGAVTMTNILNAAMLAMPIGWIILGVMAIVAVIVSLVKHWDSVKKAFTDGGFIAGIKRIGFVIIDALLAPVQGLLNLISKIPGLGGVAKGADFIQGLRNGLDDATNVGAKSAQVAKQKNPFEDEEFAMNFTMAKTNDEINKTLNSNNDPFKAALGGKGGVGGVSGGSSGSRVLNQTLRIERININVSANELKTKAREHADEVVRYIADALNEGAVQTLNG